MTNNFQRLEIIGRLGRDPESRMDPDGNIWVNFSVCVETFKYVKAEDKSVKSLIWITVNASGLLGTACEKNLNKGRLVYVSGELIADKYGNPPKRTRDRYEAPAFEIKADLVKFLDPLPKDEADNNIPVQPALDGIE